MDFLHADSGTAHTRSRTTAEQKQDVSGESGRNRNRRKFSCRRDIQGGGKRGKLRQVGKAGTKSPENGWEWIDRMVEPVGKKSE